MKYLFFILILLFSISYELKATEAFRGYEDEQYASRLIHKKNDTPKKSVSFFHKMKNKFKKALLPGKFPSFWFAFIVSAIGAYTIYGLVAGPLAVLLVYILAKGRKKEVMKSVWGWIAGTVTGLALWFLIKIQLRSRS